MTLRKIIAGSKKVFIDTAPIIYFIEAHTVYGPIMKEIVEAFSAGKIRACTSVVTLAEVLPAPLQTGNEKLARKFADFLRNGENLQLSDISCDIAESAGRLRAIYPGLKAFDAMQISAAIEAEADLFVSNDRKLKSVKEIKILHLHDHVS